MEKSRNLSSGKTSQGHLSATAGRISGLSLKKSPKSKMGGLQYLDLRKGNGCQPERSWQTVTASHGELTMRNIGECPREERGSTLSQILQENAPDGVCDLCGNHWEMTAGLRLVKGAIEYIKDNDAAVADLAPDSKAWQRAKTAAGQDIFLGTNISGGVTVTAEAQEGFYKRCSLEDLEIKLEEEPEILEQLGIVSPRVEEEKAYIYVNSKNDESMALRGSDFNSVYCGGIGALNFSYPRSYVSGIIGFRSAYVEF